MKLVYKRLLAYIIDMIIITICLSLINIFLKDNDYIYQSRFLNEQYSSNQIDFTSYKNEFIKLNYEMDKANIVVNISMVIIIIVFMVLIPYFKDGQTIGLKLMKLKITKDKLTIKDLLIRNFIATGLGHLILIFLLLLLNSNIYFVLINFLAFCQVLVVIINSFMISYSYKHLGLTDILTNSKVEEI